MGDAGTLITARHDSARSVTTGQNQSRREQIVPFSSKGIKQKRFQQDRCVVVKNLVAQAQSVPDTPT